MSRYVPPALPYDPTDRSGYETVVKRWPVITTNIIDHVYRLDHTIAADGGLDEDTRAAKHAEGKAIIQTASKLKYEMGHDRPLERIVDDGGPDVQVYNDALAALGPKNTWFTAPWLFAECYLYRLFRSWFATTTHWRDHDPFFEQKCDAFTASGAAVFQLAGMMNELSTGPDLKNDMGRLEIVFREMLQICLWGNATDLSLLTSLTHADIAALQTAERSAQAERAKFIMKDDTASAWACLSSARDARVDIVLDNAGFELFTDLLLADFLLTVSPFARQVVLHPKKIPWFVSDVTSRDLDWLLDFLASPSFADAPPDDAHVRALAARWRDHLASGRLVLRHDSFWTAPAAFHHLRADAPALAEHLSHSALVVFKGDLNYRKLTGDVRWPTDTPFATALGPLRGLAPVLALRTNKADVAVGLEDDVVKRTEAEDPRWRVSGRYGMIAFESGSE